MLRVHNTVIPKFPNARAAQALLGRFLEPPDNLIVRTSFSGVLANEKPFGGAGVHSSVPGKQPLYLSGAMLRATTSARNDGRKSLYVDCAAFAILIDVMGRARARMPRYRASGEFAMKAMSFDTLCSNRWMSPIPRNHISVE